MHSLTTPLVSRCLLYLATSYHGQVNADTPPEEACPLRTSLDREAGERRIRDRDASERRIRDAAIALFAQHGYDEVTVRMIAAEARVNVALINRYFGSKVKLFSAALAAESPAKDLSGLTAVELPGFLATRSATACKDRTTLRALYRSTNAPEAREVLRELVETRVVTQIAALLTGPDALQRARTAASILMGIAAGRTIFGQDDLPEDKLIERLKTIFHHCLFDQ